MINCHLTGGRHEKVLILQTLSHTSARQEKFCRGYLANRMWFSVVCTLIDNDTCHQSDQNVVDSGGVISHNIKDRFCHDLLTIENTDSDLKVHVHHYANELLVRVRLSFKNFCKLRRKNTNNVWQNSNKA